VFTLPRLDTAELNLIMKIGPLPDAQDRLSLHQNALDPAFQLARRTPT
jgi:hypothetical protein